MKFHVIAGLVCFSLSAGAAIAQNQSEPPAPLPGQYENNAKSFNLEFKWSAQTLRATDNAIRCGLAPAVALPASQANLEAQLLLKAESSFGDGKGNISYAGTAEYFQAAKALNSLSDQLSFERKSSGSPPSSLCESADMKHLGAVLRGLVNSG